MRWHNLEEWMHTMASDQGHIRHCILYAFQKELLWNDLSRFSWRHRDSRDSVRKISWEILTSKRTNILAKNLKTSHRPRNIQTDQNLWKEKKHATYRIERWIAFAEGERDFLKDPCCIFITFILLFIFYKTYKIYMRMLNERKLINFSRILSVIINCNENCLWFFIRLIIFLFGGYLSKYFY